MNAPPVFPRRSRGRKPASPDALATREADERAQDISLCAWLEERFRKNGFAFGTRGWGYVCEGVNIIDKGQLDAFEGWLVRVRQEGLIDPNVVSDDETRAADNVEQVDAHDLDAIARDARAFARYRLDNYAPISMWEGLDTYCEVMVEKIDLKILFAPVCKRYGVVLVNGKGSADVNLRRRMLQRFKVQEEGGRDCVLLYCGDHDPAGLRISDVLKRNLMDCTNIRDVKWDPSPIRIDRFGLNGDQIATLGLPWINNLITGSGKDLADPNHPDHEKSYVREYIAAHGSRKVEANALAAVPEAAQAMVEAAINRYVPAYWPDFHAARLAPHRQAAREAFSRLILDEGLS